MKRILLTGFEPFHEYKINSSWSLVDSFKNTTSDFESIKLLLPVEFKAVSNLVPEMLKQYQPDIVLAFGQCTSDSIRIERVALNLDDARTADNSGYTPIDELIHVDGKNAYFSSLPIKAIQHAVVAKNIPAIMSNSAGTYVCNHLFYELLYWCDKLSLPTKIGFVHLPRLPEQVIGTQNPSMPLQQMQIALHEIIKIL
jgi:pyroglutamyl-peptidase